MTSIKILLGKDRYVACLQAYPVFIHAIIANLNSTQKEIVNLPFWERIHDDKGIQLVRYPLVEAFSRISRKFNETVGIKIMTLIEKRSFTWLVANPTYQEDTEYIEVFNRYKPITLDECLTCGIGQIRVKTISPSILREPSINLDNLEELLEIYKS